MICHTCKRDLPQESFKTYKITIENKSCKRCLCLTKTKREEIKKLSKDQILLKIRNVCMGVVQ